jgi:rhamnosyltransferase
LSDIDMIETSILIPTKNGADDLGACLEAIYSQKGVKPFEVIVVDSGSSDATLEIARRYPVRLEQIPSEAFHHARTRNYLASLAKGDFLVFLSQDAIPAVETWLGAMVSNFSDPSVAAVYGRQRPKPDATFERQDVLDALYGDEKIVKDPSNRAGLSYRHYHFSSANSAIRRDVWRTTRFPEELRVFEDMGIAKRILDGGWKIVYDPGASVYHSHEHTTTGLFKRYFDIGYTLRKLGIWREMTKSSLLWDASKLVRRKLARFNGNGNSLKIGASLSQDLAKSAGMFLGLNERFLPFSVKRRLSAFRVYD